VSKINIFRVILAIRALKIPLRLLLAATLVVCFAEISRAVEKTHPYVIAEATKVRSRILGEDRQIFIYNPEVSAANRLPAYPVLYLLVENDMAMVTGMVSYLSSYNEQLPAMIVVGIDGGSTQIRDFTPTHSLTDNTGKLDPDPESWLKPSGGGDAFLSFMREELIPYVENHYKTAPFRIIAGHSVGGLITTHALLSHPAMFNAYLTASPSLWWDQGVVPRIAAEKLRSTRLNNRFFFLADCPEEGSFERYVARFRRAIKGVPGLESNYRYYPAERHGSIAARAYYDGLRFLFPSWDITSTDTSAALVKAHYRKIGERLGYSVQPPLGMTADWAQHFLNEGKIADAIELFEINVRNFPLSANVHADLGRAFERKGEIQPALVSYRKAIELNPGDEQTKTAIAKLEGH